MSRYAWLILLGMVLVLPWAARRLLVGAAGPTMDTNGERLVVLTPHNQDIRREFSYAFDRWHRAKFGTPVEIDWRTPGGTNDIRRMLEDTYRSYGKEGRLPDEWHVVFGGGDEFFNGLKKRDILQPMALDRQLLASAFPKPSLAGVNLLDGTTDASGRPTPAWVGVCLSSFGIAYNPDVFGALRLREPRTWSDLTHAKLSGLVALADPTHSGSAAVAYMMVIQREIANAEEAFIQSRPGADRMPRAELVKDAEYQRQLAEGWKKGMKILVLIAANARYFSSSSSHVSNDVAHGQAAAGVTIDFYGRVYQDSVGPQRCRFVAPAAATAITPDPVAILRGVSGRKAELARRFVEFLLSPEGQRIWIVRAGQPGGPVARSLRRPPIRPDLYADKTDWTDDVNPFEEAGGFNVRSEWMAQVSDIRPVWTAAWIDSRDALKDAYAAVLEVSNRKTRAALISQLADLPINLDDVARLQARRIEAEKGGNADEWKAANRIRWANEFRKHYLAIRQTALGITRKQQQKRVANPRIETATPSSGEGG